MNKLRWQFSLFGLFVVMTVAAIYFALVPNFPRTAAAIAFCCLMAILLYLADRIVAAGTTPAGARVLLFLTVFAWFLAGNGMMFFAGLFAAHGVVVPADDSSRWLIVVPLAAGGIMCVIAGVRAARKRRHAD